MNVETLDFSSVLPSSAQDPAGMCWYYNQNLQKNVFQSNPNTKSSLSGYNQSPLNPKHSSG